MNDITAEAPQQIGTIAPADQATLSALITTLRVRDAETELHCERVVSLSILIGRELGLDHDQMVSLKYGAQLHDIGKIGVPDAILRKPGRLTTEEWTTMRRHPSIGLQILSGIPFLHDASSVVAQHHERWDGKGYPDGLVGEEICANARIFTVVDAFDAMTNNRAYQLGKGIDAALDELQRCAGKQFDPEVVDAFIRMRKIWTNGLAA